MSEPLYADWAIVGAQHGRGVRVIASKNMKSGSSLSIVQAEAEGTFRGQRVRTYEHEAWKITLMAEDVVIVDAEDYPTAMRILFANWSVPEPPEPVREIFAASPTLSAPDEPIVVGFPGEWKAIEPRLDETAMDERTRQVIQRVLDEEP